MLKDVLNLSHQTLVYGLGDAAAKVAALLLLPLYTHYLSPSDYGVLVLVGLVGSITAVLLEMGLRTALFKSYYETDVATERETLTGTVLLFVLGSSATIVGAAVAASFFFVPEWLRPPSVLPLVRLALLASVFEVGGIVPFGVFRAEQRAKSYAALSAMRFVVNAASNVTAVAILKLGVTGVMYANLLTACCSLVAGLVLVRKSISWTFQLYRLPALLRFGLPLVLANLAGWAMAVSDRFVLEGFSSARQVGVYSASYRVADLLRMASGWFFLAYVPYAFANAKRPDAKQLLGRMVTYFVLVLAGLALWVALLAPDIVKLIAPPDFFGGHRVIPLLLLGNLFYGLFYLVSLSFDLSGKTQYPVLVVLVGGVANVGLNLALIPPLGMMGAAVATLLTFMLLLIIAYPLAQRVYQVRYEFSRLGKLAMASGAVYSLGHLTRGTDSILNVAATGGWLLTWVLALYVSRFFTGEEMQGLKKAYARGIAFTRTKATH